MVCQTVLYTYFLSTYLTFVGVVNIAKYLILTPTGSCHLTFHHHSPFFLLTSQGHLAVKFLLSPSSPLPPSPLPSRPLAPPLAPNQRLTPVPSLFFIILIPTLLLVFIQGSRRGLYLLPSLPSPSPVFPDSSPLLRLHCRLPRALRIHSSCQGCLSPCAPGNAPLPRLLSAPQHYPSLPFASL